MIQTEDILEKIKRYFGEESKEATRILHDSTHRVDYLDNDRILRCIVYLSNGSLKELKNAIRQATEDPRDVMLWAEYEGLKNGEQLKRVRDFNKTVAEQKDLKK